MTIFILCAGSLVLSFGFITIVCTVGMIVYLLMNAENEEVKQIPKVKIEIFTDKKGCTQFCLLETIEFFYRNMKYVIPVGFVSDGASIPRLFWRILDPRINSKTLKPSIKHDFVYRTPSVRITRKQADKMYYQELRENDYRRCKCVLVYLGVRLGGWLSYKKRKPAK